VTGIVTRDKAAKTRRVEVTRLVRHPQYGKIMRRRTVCVAHDEENQSHSGDLVEIEESRPLSRTKRWKLLRVVSKAQEGLATAEAGEAGETASS
jgi:small subunit ribosomal protein S17